VLAAEALTLAVAVSAVGGWSLGVATSSPARSTLGSAALLSASGQPVGTIFFYGGSEVRSPRTAKATPERTRAGPHGGVMRDSRGPGSIAGL
jgi:hypothetical protein